MPVIGCNATVFYDTGLMCTVNAFTDAVGQLEQVKIVDAVLAYDCHIKGKTYLLVIRNALLIPQLEGNLISPFMLREEGIIVDEFPKFQSPSPSIETHSMYCKEANLQIHFGLHNTFSYFETRKPTEEELSACDKLFITPDNAVCNTHSDHFLRMNNL